MKREFLVKLNHEFESNLLRQPVWRFCFSIVDQSKKIDFAALIARISHVTGVLRAT
jgi:hypothetical protein